MAKKKDGPRYLTKALRCPDGSRKYIRGKTKEELERKVMQAQAELGLGININDNTTVAQFAQMWVDVYKRPSIAPQSLDVILNRLNNHILPHIGHKKVRDVRPSDCALVLAAASKLAKSSAVGVRTTLKELFECAVDNEVAVRNPVTRSIAANGRPATEKSPLTEAQLDELCRACAGRKKLEDALTFVMIVRYTGLRASEVLGLHTSNIDLLASELRVEEQYFSRNGVSGTTRQLKSDAAKRVVPIPLPLLAYITGPCVAREGGYLFNVKDPCLYTRISSQLRALCRVDRDGSQRKCNPSIAVLDFYVHPHLLRHTYATRCVASGMDVKTVQYLLGHASLDMTLGVYSHYQMEHQIKATAGSLNSVFMPRLSVVGE
jgi:integrase